MAGFLVISLLTSLLPPVGVEAFFGFGEKESEAPKVERTKLVTIFVEQSLLEPRRRKNKTKTELKDAIERYAHDVQEAVDAQVVLIPTPKDASPREIYEGNGDLYFSGLGQDNLSQLIGTIFIGDVPLPVVEKEGNFWPTVFPYVDFVDPIYRWDKQRDRFVYQGNQTHEPEIWHGVIRPDIKDKDLPLEDYQDKQDKQLIDYFDRNHKVHRGEVTFGKKLFFADLPAQKLGLPENLRIRYNNWVQYIEDKLYFRHNQPFFQEVIASQPEDDFPESLLPQGAKAGGDTTASSVLEEAGSDFEQSVVASQGDEVQSLDLSEEPSSGGGFEDVDVAGMADIHTKNLIDNFLKRYIEAYSGILSKFNTILTKAGRWEASDIDTTVSLVSRKDEASALFLKAGSDALEQKLISKLEALNIPAKIPITSIQTLPGGTRQEPAPIIKDKYLNGVKISSSGFEAETCTLNRGTLVNDEGAFAQGIEGNRTFNFDTANDCDNAGGCCAQNLTFDDDGEVFASSCNAGSNWISPTQHNGAQVPVFDIKGTKVVSSITVGAKGCQSLIDANTLRNIHPDEGFVEVDSLVLHQEPTLETLGDQVESFNARAVPVDDPRGFSFYDAALNFYRLDFLNLFDLREKFLASDEATRATLLEAELFDLLEEKINEINTVVNVSNATSDANFINDRDNVLWPGDEVEPFSGFTPDCSYTKDVVLGSGVTESSGIGDRTIEWVRTCTFEEDTGGGEGEGEEEEEESGGDSFAEIDKVKRRYSRAGTLTLETFNTYLKALGVDRIIDAVLWLDKDIETKNKQVFLSAFDEVAPAKEFLFSEDFNGYEMVEIVGDASSQADRLDLSFEQGEAVGRETFRILQQQALNFELEKGEAASSFDTEKELVFSPEQEALLPTRSSNAPPASLVILNEPWQVFAGDSTPREIVVEVRDSLGNVLEDDFTSEVNLALVGAKKEEFFRIGPEQTLKVKEGKATFFLVPETHTLPAFFDVVATSASLSAKQSLKVTDLDLKLSTDQDHLFVNDTEGTVLHLRTEDIHGNKSTRLDGTKIFFHSNGGTFENEAQALLRDGEASLKFFPGKSSGEVSVWVEHENQQLPRSEIVLELLPSDPAVLVFETEVNRLVRGGGFIPLRAHLLDQYGNGVEEGEHRWTWRFEGLEVESPVENTEYFDDHLLQVTQEEASSEVLIRPTGKAQEARLEVYADVLGPGQGRALSFPIGEKGYLQVEIDREKAVAGEQEEIPVSVSLLDEENRPLTLTLGGGILSDNPEVGEFPKSFTVENGKGSFSFSPGVRAGKTNITLTVPGFTKASFPFEVVAGKAQKIELKAPAAFLSASETKDFLLELKVVDRFGNVAKNYHDHVQLRVNDTTIPLQSTGEQVQERGLLQDPGQQQFFDALDDQEPVSDQTIVTFPSSSVSFTEGKATVKLTPTGKSGKVYLTARHQNLVPGVLELEVVNDFLASSLETLFPKALFLLLLGFEGADVLEPENIAQQFLFSSWAQSVGSLITDPLARKRMGYLQPSGEVSASLRARLQPGMVPKITLKNSEQDLLELVLWFGKEVSFQLKKETEDSLLEGVSFMPKDEYQSSIRQKDRSILLGNEPLFTLTSSGGVLPQFGALEFSMIDPTDVTRWQVMIQDQVLGELTYHLGGIGNQEVVSLSDLEDLDPTYAPGMYTELLASGVALEKAFVGNATTGRRGVALVVADQKEEAEKMLGSPNVSAEDSHQSRELGWDENWKPGALFAAGNTVGESVAWGSSDAFLLLGDPTIRLANDNLAPLSGLDQDIGTPLWKSLRGSIDATLSSDINLDGEKDILALIGDRLWLLLQEDYDEREHVGFKDMGPLLRFSDGVKSLEAYENKDGELQYLVQLNQKNEIILHKNDAGVLSRAPFSFELDAPIETFKKARLNGDPYQDLVLLDTENTLYYVYGTKDGGFLAPEAMETFSPSFSPINETYSAALASKNATKVNIPNKTPTLDLFLVHFPGIDAQVHPQANPSFQQDGASYYKLTENGGFNATLLAHEATEKKSRLRVGDHLRFTLGLRANTSVENLNFLFPNIAGLVLEEKTFVCRSCKTEPVLSTKAPKGAFQVSGVTLPPQQQVVLTWEMKIAAVDPIDFRINDVDTDGIDDVSVIWQDDQANPVFVDFLSSQIRGPQAWKSHWVAQKSGSGPSKKSPTSVRSVTPPKNQTVDETDRYNSQVGDLKSKNSDGLPQYYQDSAPYSIGFDFSSLSGLASLVNGKVGEMENHLKDSALCGVGCAGSTIISQASPSAPGIVLEYHPPNAVQVDVSAGFPIFAVPTKPKPRVWPPKSGGWKEVSDFRIYLIPTNTPDTGMAFCRGPYKSGMSTHKWNANCHVVAVPTLKLQACPPEQKVDFEFLLHESQSSVNGKLLSVGNKSEAKTKGSFNLREEVPRFPHVYKFNLTNRNIVGVDVMTRWLQLQFEQLTNIKLPSVKFVLPKVPRLADNNASSTDKLLQSLVRYQPPSYDEARKELEAIKQRSARLKELDEKEKRTEKKLLEDLKKFFPDFQRSLPELKKQLPQLRETEEELQEVVDDIEKALPAFEEDITKKKNKKIQKASSLQDVSKILAPPSKGQEKIGGSNLFEKLFSLVRKKLKERKREVDFRNPQQRKVVRQKALEEKLERQAGAKVIGEYETFYDEVDEVLGDYARYLEDLRLVNLRREKIVVPYPAIPAHELNAMRRQTATWFEEVGDLSQRIKNRLREYEQAYEASCEEPDLRCVRLEKAIEQAKDFLLKLKLTAGDVGQNLVAIESYVEAVRELKTIPQEIRKVMTTVEKNVKLLRRYFEHWFERIVQATERWNQYTRQIRNTYRLWETVVEIFGDFTVQCVKCSGDRGTIPEFYLRAVLLADAKFPVYSPPRQDGTNIREKTDEPEIADLPDQIYDFSLLKTALDIEYPDIGFEAIDVAFPSPPIIDNLDQNPLSEITDNLDFELNFPLLRTVPRLKPIPKDHIRNKLSFRPSVPAVKIPPLRVFENPPKVPDIMGKLMDVANLASPHLDLFCKLQTNSTVVPEWYVKGYVEQLTNRAAILKRDFEEKAPFVVKPRTRIKDVEYPIDFDYLLHVKDMTEKSRDIAKQFVCLMEELPLVQEALADDQKARYFRDPCPLGAHPERGKSASSDLPGKTFVKAEPSTKVVAFDMEKALHQRPLEEALQEKEVLSHINEGVKLDQDQKVLLAGLLEQNFPGVSINPQTIPTHLSPERYKHWLVSTLDPEQSPSQAEPSGSNPSIKAAPGAYFIDPLTKEPQLLHKMSFTNKRSFALSDIDDDGVEEILFSLGEELYWKDFEGVGSKHKRLAKRSKRLFRGNLGYETFDDFAQRLLPGNDIRAGSTSAGSTLSFEASPQVSYYHWTTSRRVDHTLKDGATPSESLKHKGLLLREPEEGAPTPRQSSASVTDIKGHPLFFGPEIKELPRFRKSECDNIDKEKPFFQKPVTLTGLQTSEFFVRFPATSEREKETRLFQLERGEELTLQEGEICLVTGSLVVPEGEALTSRKLEKSWPVVSGSKIQTGAKESVEVTLFDGSVVKIGPNQTYQFVLDEEAPSSVQIDQFLPKNNFYGSLYGLSSGKKTSVMTKLLHDPQESDDQRSPNIVVAGGSYHRVALFGKLALDASGSRDDEALAKAWWDLDANIDTDGDGDPENDQDFPSPKEASDYAPREVLRIGLPRFEEVGVFSLVLFVQDKAGNLAKEKVTIEVTPSSLSLLDVNKRSKQVLGQVGNGAENVRVSLVRKRDRQWDFVRDEPITSGAEGRVEIQEASVDGGVEILDKDTRDVLAQVLRNGKVVLHSERIGFSVETSNQDHGLSLRLRDERDQTIGWVSFALAGESDVVIVPPSPKSFPPEILGTLGKVYVIDRSPNDRYSFQSFPADYVPYNGAVALIDGAVKDTVLIIDKQGNVAQSPRANLELRLKASTDKDQPLLFEILDSRGRPIADLFLAVKPEIWVENETLNFSPEEKSIE